MADLLVVADSGPLIALARIKQLPLLPKLFKEIIVPNAVWDEVTVKGKGSPGANEVKEAKWIKIKSVDSSSVEHVALLLGQGEAEAIVLAESLPDSLVLLDDARARRVAERFGIKHMGTLGVLIMAKKQGFISEVRTHLESLQLNGIFIKQTLMDSVLKKVGE